MDAGMWVGWTGSGEGRGNEGGNAGERQLKLRDT